eukprot:TRINITY_DN2960_c2_g1_i1.p1 TRINITY_DN2960_c2_g1~~TRINITY_DN2960_c2_g1_i1.p1  ORF type:complete len:1123 (-),score=368.74 TRINITY_DN2960_c2_g1_i1:1138-4506(-)
MKRKIGEVSEQESFPRGTRDDHKPAAKHKPNTMESIFSNRSLNELEKPSKKPRTLNEKKAPTTVKVPRKPLTRKQKLKVLASEGSVFDALDKQDEEAETKRARNETGFLSTSAPRHVHHLTLTKLTEGQTILGAVRSIRDLSLLISLPNNLLGNVEITEVSDALSQVLGSIDDEDSDLKKSDLVEEDDSGSDQDDDENLSIKARAAAKKASSAKISPTEVPSLHDYFQYGDYVVCTINTIDHNSNRISLSLKPGHINRHYSKHHIIPGMPLTGAVQSVEDHGYIISFENPEFIGFMKHSDDATQRLKSGQLVRVLVEKVGGNNVINVVRDDEKWRKTVTKASSVPSIDCIAPGMLVKAQVQKFMEDGLWLQFLDFYGGIVEGIHTGIVDPAAREAKWGSGTMEEEGEDEEEEEGDNKSKKSKKKNKKGDKKKKAKTIRARVLYIDRESKKIGLTLAPHLVAFEKKIYGPEFAIGKIVTSTPTVLSNIGLFSTAQLYKPAPQLSKQQKKAKKKSQNPDSMQEDEPQPQEENKQEEQKEEEQVVEEIAFAYTSKLSDDEEDLTPHKLRTKFAPGTRHKARVIAYNLIDGVILLAYNKTTLDQTFLGYHDLKPGTIIHAAKVIKMSPSHRTVFFSLGPVSAICSALHFSETPLAKPELKFASGVKMPVRVLSVDVKNNVVLVTAIKTLVESKLPVLRSLNEAKEGQIVHGIVTGVADFGVFFAFYNNITALCGKSDVYHYYNQYPQRDETGKDLRPSLETFIKKGQVREVRILSITKADEGNNNDSNNGRVSVSLTLTAPKVDYNYNGTGQSKTQVKKQEKRERIEEDKKIEEQNKKQQESIDDKRAHIFSTSHKTKDGYRNAIKQEDYTTMRPGDKLATRLIELTPYGAITFINRLTQGFISVFDMGTDIKTITDVQNNIKIGQVIRVTIKGMDEKYNESDNNKRHATQLKRGRVFLTMLNNEEDGTNDKGKEELKAGETVMGVVYNWYTIMFKNGEYGQVVEGMVGEEEEKMTPFKEYEAGRLVNCNIKEKNKNAVKVEVDGRVVSLVLSNTVVSNPKIDSIYSTFIAQNKTKKKKKPRKKEEKKNNKRNKNKTRNKNKIIKKRNKNKIIKKRNKNKIITKCK